MDSLAAIIGGLGLFFAGVWILTDNLKRLTGRRIRQAMIGWTRHPPMAFGWGMLAGGITQSMSVLVFILVGLLTAGLITVKTALPIIAGANVGASILVLLATLDIKLVMLFIIGITGIAMTSEKLIHSQPLIGTLFGLGLLFLGIDTLQSGAIPLVQQPWAANLLEKARESYLSVFLVGAALTFVAQSSAAISILAITMSTAGVFSIEQAIMTIYGANLGSSAISLVLSWNLRGRLMQIALFQIVINIIACLILVPLFYLELYTDTPLMIALISKFPGGFEQQLAYVYLLFNLIGATAMLSLKPVMLKVTEKLFPPTRAEDDARLCFIHDRALQDPDTAIDLVRLEQNRLISFFSRQFESLRSISDDKQSPLVLRNSFQTLALGIDEFLDELAHTDPNHATYENLNRAINRQRLIKAVEETIYELTLTIEPILNEAQLQKFEYIIIEGLDTVALTLQSAIVDGNKADAKRLEKMVGDRSETMQRIRTAYLVEELSLEAPTKLTMLKITNLCERFFWLLGDLTKATTAEDITQY